MYRSKTATDGTNRVSGVHSPSAEGRSTERKRKERKLIDLATEIAIEMYEPALKELEKH